MRRSSIESAGKATSTVSSRPGKWSYAFNPGSKVVRVFFDDAEVQHYRRDQDVILIKDRVLEIPMPPERGIGAGR